MLEGKVSLSERVDVVTLGLNQAFALFMAGVKNVRYHGIVGGDGEWMIDELKKLGFPSENILESGHTIIQVQEHNNGENAILLHYGANYQFTEELLREILSDAQPGDYLLLQCETNLIGYAMRYAKQVKGMRVIFNTAPYPPKVEGEWSECFPSDWIVANRAEAKEILPNAKSEIGSEEGMREMLAITGTESLIVTLGGEGCRALIKIGSNYEYFKLPACKVSPVDTTGAGDVFLGYFFGTLMERPGQFKAALHMGIAAAALSVTKRGALCSTPALERVQQFLASLTSLDA